jgi:hypothetical protein
VDETQGFKKLIAWQRADELATLMFVVSREVAKTYPWLASQVSRDHSGGVGQIREEYETYEVDV